jgi:hypothetical protein
MRRTSQLIKPVQPRGLINLRALCDSKRAIEAARTLKYRSRLTARVQAMLQQGMSVAAVNKWAIAQVHKPYSAPLRQRRDTANWVAKLTALAARHLAAGHTWSYARAKKDLDQATDWLRAPSETAVYRKCAGYSVATVQQWVKARMRTYQRS